jgi:hypothetical protein
MWGLGCAPRTIAARQARATENGVIPPRNDGTIERGWRKNSLFHGFEKIITFAPSNNRI